MAERKVKTRIQNKFDLKENWDKAESFTPLPGEIITIAPNTEMWPGAGYENNSGREGCPLRIKIGDGERTLRKLPYIGMPAVSKDTGGNSIDVIGFESITKFQNSGTATIRVNLNRDSVGAAKNFDDMEHFHHRFYLTSNIDTRTNEVNLLLTVIKPCITPVSSL